MDIKGDETFLDEGSKAVLHIESLGQVVYAFINGKLAGINFTLSSHKQLKFSLAQSFLTVSMISIALYTILRLQEADMANRRFLWISRLILLPGRTQLISLV